MTEKIEEQIVQSKLFENMQSDTDKATFQVPGKIQHTYQMTKRPFSLAGLLSFYFFLIKEHGDMYAFGVCMDFGRLVQAGLYQFLILVFIKKSFRLFSARSVFSSVSSGNFGSWFHVKDKQMDTSVMTERKQR